VILPETHLVLDIGDIQVRAPIAVGFRYGEHTRGNLHFTGNQLEISVVIWPRDKAPSSPAGDFNEDQVRFWQDHGQLGKSVVAADLLDLSFIGEEAITPQSWRH